MPHGCWIDLYETPDLSGECRRIFGPSELDAVVWRRFAASDTVSLHVGPSATVHLIARDGTERRLEPDAVGRGLRVSGIASITIRRVRAVADDQTPAEREVVRREVGDPLPEPRAPRRPDAAPPDDEPAACAADADEWC